MVRKRSGREENINSRTESDRDQGRRMQKEIDKSSETKQRHYIIRKQTDIKTVELKNVHRIASLSSSSQA